MIIVECAGDGRARGRAHGEAARDLIAAAIARWQENLPVGSQPLAYARRFLSETGLVAAAERATPELVEEVRGIAESARIEEELLLAYNLMDEQWWYDLAPVAEPGCSLLGLHTEAGTLLAQNMDVPAWMDGSQLVLRVSGPDIADALVLTSAGLIGLNGVNRNGIAVCVNTLLMLPHGGSRVGVAFAVRGALGRPTRDAAEGFLRALPHASGQHYAVADRRGMVGLECGADAVVTSSPAGDGRLLHTNHPLAHSGRDPKAEAILRDSGRLANSERRLEVLTDLVGTMREPGDARRVLADRSAPLCVTPTEWRATQTFAGVSFVLPAGGGPPVAEFCLGRPDTAPWERVAWR